MESLWPWLAVAGLGALHGLNPATGWALAAACGVRGRDRRGALRALVPIGLGHAASIALVAGAVALGLALDRTAMQLTAGGLLVAALALRTLRLGARSGRRPAGAVAVGLGSFMASSAHGAGLMLVPALMPLCVGSPATGPLAGASPLLLALAAVAVHGAAMLAVTGLVASAVCLAVAATTRPARWLRAARAP